MFSSLFNSMTVKRWILLSVVVFVAVGGAYYFFGNSNSQNFTGRLNLGQLNAPNLGGGGAAPAAETPPAEGGEATPPAEGAGSQLPGFFNGGAAPTVVDGGEAPAGETTAETPPAEGGAAQIPGFFNGANPPAVVDGGEANQGAQQGNAQGANTPLAGQTINLGNLTPHFPNAQNGAEPAAETGPIMHTVEAAPNQSQGRLIPVNGELTEVLRVRITPVQTTSLSSVRLSLDTTVDQPQILGDRMQVQLFWQEQNAAEATPLVAEPVNSNNTYRQFDFSNLNRQLTVGVNQAQERKYFDLIAKVKIIPLGIADLNAARTVRNFKFKIADDGDIRFLAGPNNRINGFTWSENLAGNLMTVDDALQFNGGAQPQEEGFAPPEGARVHLVIADNVIPADTSLLPGSEELKEVYRIGIRPVSDTIFRGIVLQPDGTGLPAQTTPLDPRRLRAQLWIEEPGQEPKALSEIIDVSANGKFEFMGINENLNIDERRSVLIGNPVFYLSLKMKVLPKSAADNTDSKAIKFISALPMYVAFGPQGHMAGPVGTGITSRPITVNDALLANNDPPPPPPAGEDMCSDIVGVQDSVPLGRRQNENGTCPLIDFLPNDQCSNIDGSQLLIPVGKVRGENNSCIDRIVFAEDMCSDIEGVQATEDSIPAGHTHNADNTCPLTQLPVVDFCSNIDGEQLEIPAGKIAGENNTCNDPSPPPPPPPADPVDQCLNINGMQEQVPVGLTRDANGICNDGALPDLPPLPGPQCANLGMYTYSGPDRPNLTNGGCIPCENNLYIATNGSCTIAPATQVVATTSSLNNQSQTSQLHNAAYDGPQTYAPNTNGASLEYSQRLVRAPERGSTGPAANLYVLLAGLSAAMVALYRKVKK